MASQKQKTNIKIIYWNCDSLTSKLYEFRNFLTIHNPDLVLLNETHLSEKRKIRFCNYSMYRNDRNNDGGGAAILI